jgi:hypothetical protein
MGKGLEHIQSNIYFSEVYLPYQGIATLPASSTYHPYMCEVSLITIFRLP